MTEQEVRRGAIETLEEGLQNLANQIGSESFARALRAMIPQGGGKAECRIIAMTDKRGRGLVLNMSMRSVGAKKQRGTFLELE